MTAEDYNAKSMKRYGWGPSRFGLEPDASIEDITEAVADFQRESGLTPDGKVGPMTWRRMEAEREFGASESYPSSLGFIQVSGSPIPVDFKAQMCSSNSPYSLVGQGGHSRRKNPPTQVVWHWDACLNAETCYKILQRRKISSHGVIDNDGTFYQMLDFADHTGWHSGDSKVNRRSIGIDISNAVYLKYNKYYEKRWGPRPVIKAEVHGHEYELLGYYDAQIRTAAKLSAFIAKHFSIDLVTPDSNTVIGKPHLYRGHLAHYHVKRTKWDVAGFPFDDVLGYTEPLE